MRLAGIAFLTLSVVLTGCSGGTGNNGTSSTPVVGIISTVAGNGTFGYSGDGGPATSAKLDGPVDTAMDSSGNLYIAEENDNRVRKVTPSGIITTYAGNGTPGSSGDGGPATSATLYIPMSLAVDSANNLYIAEYGNSRVRMVTPAGIITTYAGNGMQGFSGDGGAATAAEVADPESIAVDNSGNLYIAANNRIRKVTANGIISTIAGNGTIGFSGDGGLATSAQFASPSAIAVDNASNVYIADANNNRIRKVTAAGIITTFAGSATQGFSGDGGPVASAELSINRTIGGVAVDSNGNVYIADTGNNLIRKVTIATGIISTIAGAMPGGFGGDGGSATLANMSAPQGLAVDSSGSVYVTDAENLRIRKVTF